MTLRWERRHFGPGAMGYDGALLIGQIARYDIVEPGRTEVLGHYFMGFLRGEPATGRCDSLDEAQSAVERARVMPDRSMRIREQT